MLEREAERFAEKYGPSNAYCSMTEIMGNNREIAGLKKGYITGATEICKKILEEAENYNSSCADIEEYGIYIEPLENIMKKLGVNIDDRRRKSRRICR